MTFGRWLLVHSFSIFLVGLLLFGYLYREELKLEQAYQQLLNLEEPDAVIDALSPPADAVPVAAAESPEVEKRVLENDPTIVPESAESQPTRSVATPLVEARPTISKTPRHFGEQLLMSARQAYWNRDYRTSIDRYRQLLNQQPQNPDFNGELGNVYYAMNDYERAAQQYYRAAHLLLDQDQVEAARQLISPITAMDRALGERLQSRFRQLDEST